ncbi:MAG: SRPBCC domain-containing protein [Phycisphaerales bacterium]|nr:SRPBCC domain-containing protein [Phycisphaerales bacterium]
MAGVRRVVDYPYPPEDVWAALTDRRALAEWLMPNDFAPEVGHRFRFQTDPNPICGTGITECEVLELEAPTRMVWSWQHTPPPGRPKPPLTTVTWSLARSVDGGTRLTLQHDGFSGFRMWLLSVVMARGWGMFLRRTLPRAAAHVRDGSFTPGAIPLAERLVQTRTVPEHLTR